MNRTSSQPPGAETVQQEEIGLMSVLVSAEAGVLTAGSREDRGAHSAWKSSGRLYRR